MARTRGQEAGSAPGSAAHARIVSQNSTNADATPARPSLVLVLHYGGISSPSTSRKRSTRPPKQNLRIKKAAKSSKVIRSRKPSVRRRSGPKDALKRLAIIPDYDKKDDDYEPTRAHREVASSNLIRHSKRDAAQKATAMVSQQLKMLQKTMRGRVTKVSTKNIGKSSRTSHVTLERTVTTTTVERVRRIETVTRVATKRRRTQHFRVKLSPIRFTDLPEYIQQQDYKLLRQEKRLVDYKGRYLPPPLRKYNNSYSFMFGHNPFKHTGFQGPSKEQLWDVYELMKKDLRENFNKECFLDQPDASTNELQDGPMHMTDELSVDNLIKVILSISTENSLAIRQHAQLCSKFTYTKDGQEVVGTIPNYHRMRVCSAEELTSALNIAGHHNIRQKAFHGILDEVFEQNKRRTQPGQPFFHVNLPGATDFVPGSLSMDYLKGEGLSKQERFDLLVKFPQIAVKTGCCLLAFNLKMPVFVVDTHVHHMVRNLEWIPEGCYDADRACMFLDTLMPTELKFGLHQAFWHHRINCARCMPRASAKSKAYQERVCPLEHLIKRDLPPLRRNSSDESSVDEDGAIKPKKERAKSTSPKKLPGSVKFLNLHYKVARDKGYALRKVDIDDDFGDGSRQNKSRTAHYFWGLKQLTRDDEVIKFEDALSAVGLTEEAYEARFIKRSKARKAKLAGSGTINFEDDDETLEDILDDLSDLEDDDFADFDIDMSGAEE